MIAQSQTGGPAATGLYLPSVDGLRFVAFLLVFVEHFAPLQPTPVISVISDYGWVGVEIFFAISSFLMMRFLLAEDARRGDVNIIWFYIRRVLRIYPLMMFYALLVILLTNRGSGVAWFQFGALASATDNYLAWFFGYNYPIPYTSHLWTLSYELQIYLFIPLAYFVLKTAKAKGFIIMLAAVECLCLVARTSFAGIGVTHPVIWVTPFLRPESTLIGLAIGAGLINVRSYWAWAIVAIAVAVLVTHPNVNVMGPWTIAIYPVCALISGSLVYLAARSTLLTQVLGYPVIAFLGKISFGLYVYHFAIAALLPVLLRKVLPTASLGSFYGAELVVGFLLTVLIATLSYFVLERPFLKIKERFTIIPSRPV
jgi:peptidoglycan/LPS O-acetylase OafA/YrhL